MKQIYRFLCFQNIMTCLLHPIDKILVQGRRNTCIDVLTMVKVNNKTQERCHAVFIFSFEHMQMNFF